MWVLFVAKTKCAKINVHQYFPDIFNDKSAEIKLLQYDILLVQSNFEAACTEQMNRFTFTEGKSATFILPPFSIQLNS